MTQPKFTPGPWNHVEALPTSVWASGVWVASTNVVETFPSFEERTANAILIAAAPDMYAALEAIARLWEQYGDGFMRGPIANNARAALKKAGRQ